MMAEFDWTIAAQTIEQAFQKAEIARIEAQDKALDILLGKAREAIVAMKKILPEKQKAVKPTTDAKAVAQKAVDEVAVLIAKAPGGKADAALTKQLKNAQEKLQTTAMTEVSALAAVSAADSNVKDAEDDVKRITDSKAQNAKLIAAANAAITGSKKTQDKATADLAAAKLALTKTTAKPIAVSFSADALRVAAMFDDNSLNVWAVASGAAIDQVTGSAAPAMTLTSTADGSFVASKSVTLSTGTTPRWVLERTLGGEADQKVFADRVNAVRFSPDGKTIATGGGELSRSGDVILFDVATGKATQTWKERHGDTVLCLDFSPDGKRIASGGADKIARVTDIATGKQVNLFEGHTHHVMGIAFRADGRVLATAGADGVVSTWDMIMGERKKKIEGWTKEVTSLQFIGATNQIVTSAGDNLVRIVTDDGTEIRAISKLPDYMQAAASTPNGSAIIGGGEDSLLRVWDGAGKELAAFGAK
jgi:WD40 repeat protein